CCAVDLVRGGAEEGAPRCRRDGGGAMPWRRLTGEAGRGWPAGELLWGERVPFPGSIGAGERRRWELDGTGTAGGHGEQRRGETARRTRRHRAEGEGVRVANEKAS